MITIGDNVKIKKSKTIFHEIHGKTGWVTRIIKDKKQSLYYCLVKMDRDDYEDFSIYLNEEDLEKIDYSLTS